MQWTSYEAFQILAHDHKMLMLHAILLIGIGIFTATMHKTIIQCLDLRQNIVNRSDQNAFPSHSLIPIHFHFQEAKSPAVEEPMNFLQTISDYLLHLQAMLI